MALGLSIAAAVLWGLILLLPWQPWRTRETLDAEPCSRDADLTDVTVVIPARNEAEVIATTLGALAAQGAGLKVMLVDDNSEDATAARAAAVTGIDLTLIKGSPLPAGWSGKLWAQQQGIEAVRTPLTLLLDADIRLEAGLVASLKQKLHDEGAAFVSLMAKPPLGSFWEKLLMPAFVYFFKMLYPFALSNRRRTPVATAAGGCILMETRLFQEIGGLACIRDAIIDDCTLAKTVKSRGHALWTGLTHSVSSQRPYRGLGEIWDMVARTAYTQLLYSTALLLLCIFLMLLLFWVPVLGLFQSGALIAALALAAMLTSYLPMLRYYGLNPFWAALLPLAATLYLAMTVTSAWRYWRGERSRWKGRVYERAPEAAGAGQ